METCNKCKVEKELSDFYKNKSTKTGYSHSCKECAKTHTRNYLAVNTPPPPKTYLDYLQEQGMMEYYKKMSRYIYE